MALPSGSLPWLPQVKIIFDFFFFELQHLIAFLKLGIALLFSAGISSLLNYDDSAGRVDSCPISVYSTSPDMAYSTSDVLNNYLFSK